MTLGHWKKYTKDQIHQVDILQSNGVGHYSEPYLEFRNADAYQKAKGKKIDWLPGIIIKSLRMIFMCKTFGE